MLYTILQVYSTSPPLQLLHYLQHLLTSTGVKVGHMKKLTYEQSCGT
jgi:hypothetical protein